MAEENNRVYIDTNVLFNWLFGVKATTAKPATDFIKDVENGKYVGIISDVTLNELVKIIRNIMVERGQTDPASWERKKKEAIRKIYAIKKEQIEIVSGTINDCEKSEDDLVFGKISDQAYNIIQKYPGVAKWDDSEKKTKHKGMSTADTFHVILAKIFNCDKIASFDSDFKEVSSEIKQLVVKEIYKV